MAIVIARQLDLSGLERPVPLTRTAEALEALRPGELLEVIATDCCCFEDFGKWARSSGHDLIEASQLGHVFRFVIRKR